MFANQDTHISAVKFKGYGTIVFVNEFFHNNFNFHCVEYFLQEFSCFSNSFVIYNEFFRLTSCTFFGNSRSFFFFFFSFSFNYSFYYGSCFFYYGFYHSFFYNNFFSSHTNFSIFTKKAEQAFFAFFENFDYSFFSSNV